MQWKYISIITTMFAVKTAKCCLSVRPKTIINHITHTPIAPQRRISHNYDVY